MPLLRTIILAMISAGCLGAFAAAEEVQLPGGLEKEIPGAKSDPLSQFFRQLVLELVPREYEDLDDWGKRKNFQTGLHIGLDGLRLDTKRQYSPLNHGTWQMYRVKLSEPDQFQLAVSNVGKRDDGRLGFTVNVRAPLAVSARQSQWRRGLQLYSISADARALVDLTLECATSFELAPGKLLPQMQLQPEITAASVRLADFQLIRISKIGGDVADELGRSIRGRLQQKVATYDEKLAARINRKLAKESDHLRFSLSDLADSEFREVFALTSTSPEKATPRSSP